MGSVITVDIVAVEILETLVFDSNSFNMRRQASLILLRAKQIRADPSYHGCYHDCYRDPNFHDPHVLIIASQLIPPDLRPAPASAAAAAAERPSAMRRPQSSISIDGIMILSKRVHH